MESKSTCRNVSARCSKAGVVSPGEMYRLDEIKARMGWRDAGLSAARKAGLKTHKFGKRTYVLGSDVIALVTSGTER
jgi:hypothetical protein